MQKKTFSLFPEGTHYTIAELETLLKFRFLPKLAFETPEDKNEILVRGLDKWKKNGISLEAQKLGASFREQIETSYIAAVSIGKINEQVGYGLFAEEEIKKGSYVGEYTGIVRKNDRLYFETLNNYCYEYPVLDDIGRSFVIDATEGNLARFINHSFTPNLKPVHVFYEGFYHLIFLAMQTIEKGQQLSYDYGRNYWYLRQPPQELVQLPVL